MPTDYPSWVHGSTPHTHRDAVPTRTRAVVDVPAIRVSGATYRGSRPITGVFELVSTKPQLVVGEERFEVYCAWFGVKPPTKYPRLDVRLGTYELLPSYTGVVIDNLSNGPAVMLEEVEATDVQLPEELSPIGLVEGAVRTITVNAYERNSEARRRCIAAHGTKCSICNFSFGERYGAEAEGYIHVHHLVPLAEIGGEYEVDPVKDLRPVCANCHAVLHLGRRCREIEEVKRLLR
ncbi:MAG: HNH endonuclease [Actinobacteria bacterium]|nr:HNH endonuclease [Actinomycetota bacterium]MCL5888069.1 HNH endonuclease [Actinomycetota bacterium]